MWLGSGNEQPLKCPKVMLPTPAPPPLLPMIDDRTWFLGLELPLRQPTNSQDGLSTQLRVKDGEGSLCLPDIRPFLGLVTASQPTSAEFPGLGLLCAYCSGQAELPRLRHLPPPGCIRQTPLVRLQVLQEKQAPGAPSQWEAMVTGWRNKKGGLQDLPPSSQCKGRPEGGGVKEWWRN